MQTKHYVIPDIDYDAWSFICMSGKHVFDQFVKSYPEASGVDANIMMKLDVIISNSKRMEE